MKNNPFDSSDSESSPDQEKVRYKTRSLARRTGAADDTGNDYDEDLPSEISGLDSSFTAKHYLSVNLRDMAKNYDVSYFFVNIFYFFNPVSKCSSIVNNPNVTCIISLSSEI